MWSLIASNCQPVTSSWQVVGFVLLNWKFPMLINNTITETPPCNYQVKHIFSLVINTYHWFKSFPTTYISRSTILAVAVALTYVMMLKGCLRWRCAVSCLCLFISKSHNECKWRTGRLDQPFSVQLVNDNEEMK